MLTKDMKDELIRGLREIFKEHILMIILYGSVARDEAKDDSDIDIAIILSDEMDESLQEKFIHWSEIWIYVMTECFRLLIFRKRRSGSGERYFPFIKMYRGRGLFFGRQLKRTCGISYGAGKGDACCSGRQSGD